MYKKTTVIRLENDSKLTAHVCTSVNYAYPTKFLAQKYTCMYSFCILLYHGARRFTNPMMTEMLHHRSLQDNLLNRFLVSPQCKAVVDFEAQAPA